MKKLEKEKKFPLNKITKFTKTTILILLHFHLTTNIHTQSTQMAVYDGNVFFS